MQLKSIRWLRLPKRQHNRLGDLKRDISPVVKVGSPWSPLSRLPKDSVSGETSFTGCTRLPSSYVLTSLPLCVLLEMTFFSLLLLVHQYYKDRTPPSWLHLTRFTFLKALSPKTVTLKVGGLQHEYLGYTIQFIAIKNSYFYMWSSNYMSGMTL